MIVTVRCIVEIAISTKDRRQAENLARGVLARQGFTVVKSEIVDGGHVGDDGIRDPGAPCRDYAHGKPVGRCDRNGHPLCRECVNRRAAASAGGAVSSWDRRRDVMQPRSADKCQRGREPAIREDGSIEIPLTKGQVALISPESYQLVLNKLWCAHWTPYTRSFYAMSHRELGVGTYTCLYLSRVVLDAPPNVLVDHRNHDTLDNRRANLRLVTVAENNRNARKRAESTSRYKGVSWHCRHRRWQARIRIDGKLRQLGDFDTEEGAARAYDAAALELHGAHAFTNAMAGLLPQEGPC